MTLLQEPEAGGDFVYGGNTLAPDGNMDLDAARELFDAPPEKLERLERSAGTLTLFRGSANQPFEQEAGQLPARVENRHDADPIDQADDRCGHSTCLEYDPISGPIIGYS